MGAELGPRRRGHAQVPNGGIGGNVEEHVEQAEGIFSSISNRMTNLGPAGSGQTVKIINQVLVGIGLFAMSESASLAGAANLDPQRVVEALTGGRADSVIFREFFAKFANRDYTPTGRIANMLKDMQNAQDLGRSVGLPLPFTSLAADLNRWLVSRGLGDADMRQRWSSIADLKAIESLLEGGTSTLKLENSHCNLERTNH
ncbi:NAD(P)-dependent oxidoreductase [Caballeronia sp. EK]|uniref:NAD(P)-dependent oxidoreductase n=1 Tax=Caballeronia sp. EK TaxID=2767469 RepID=UPI001654CD9C|nr:NAD-binding protein [Caballeronia sp. EK]MBC8640669.1 NAD(P)-dependent oxidoreductase [Caballeronia sp. EK]